MHFRSLQEFDRDAGTVTLLDGVSSSTDGRTIGIIRVPQPSDDPNDPLNWPRWRKVAAFCSIMGLVILSGWVGVGISPAIILLTKEFHTDLSETTRGAVSWLVLMLGIGNFIWVPTAMLIGRRPVFLIASFGFFATIVWGAAATSFGSLMASRILCGFFSGASEALGAAIVADLFFLHERGRWMGVYMFSLSSGTSFGTIISGFLVTAKGWRWMLWLSAILAGVDALAIFFFFPETRYVRKHVTPVERTVGEFKARDHNVEETTSVSSEKPKITFVQSLKPWSSINREVNWFKLFLRPWPLLIYPAVLYATLNFSTLVAWTLCISNTYASIYQAPPYKMTPGINGLIKIPSLIGSILGALCGGELTDRYAKWHARRNNGVFEPESRLVLLVIPFLIVPAGLLLYGFGVQHRLSWAMGFMGYGLVTFGIGSIPAITCTYVIDCYFPVAFEALLLVNGLKQIFSFGFAYSVVPWVTGSGYQAAFGTMAGIQVAIMLLGLPLWYWGKQIREVSKTFRIIYWDIKLHE